jgi:hypothetical protein
MMPDVGAFQPLSGYFEVVHVGCETRPVFEDGKTRKKKTGAAITGLSGHTISEGMRSSGWPGVVAQQSNGSC